MLIKPPPEVVVLWIDRFKQGDRMDTLVISCMDPRLNAYLDKKYLDEKKYGKVEIWRNASGRIPLEDKPIEYIIKSKPKRIILEPHTDCAAKKHMYETIKSGAVKKTEDRIVNQAEKLIQGYKFSTRAEFDALVNREEELALKNRLGSAGIEVAMDVVDTLNLGTFNHTQEKMLVVSNETDAKAVEMARKSGSEVSSCYIIQGHYLNEVNPDINLALGLGIRKINMYIKDSS